MTKEYKDFIIDDTTYTTQLTKSFVNRKKYAKANPNEVRAYIPGVILAVHVKQSQKVREGEPLLILEAMKMKNDIIMPFDGIIKEVKVIPGDRVEKNKLLINIEPSK